MKRINIFKTVCATFMAMVAMASCNKENPGTSQGGGQPDVTLVSIEVKCTFETSDEMAEFYDLKSTYSVNGESVEPELITSKSLLISKKYEKDVLPKSVAFKVVMVPKAEHKPIEPDQVYHFVKKHNMTVVGYYSDGRQALLKTGGNEENLPVKGSKLEEVLSKGERNGCEHLYEAR